MWNVKDCVCVCALCFLDHGRWLVGEVDTLCDSATTYTTLDEYSSAYIYYPSISYQLLRTLEVNFLLLGKLQIH